jgi:hypothetical protein
VILARNLLGTLRNRELAQAAKDIAAETGLEHRPVADGQRVAGIYRRSVMLASGRYAMLDDGMGFSLVPWRPVIEQRLGQQLAATCAAAVCHGRLDSLVVMDLAKRRVDVRKAL